jgi:hypothetical protein
MGPLAEKQYRHSISLVQTQFKDALLPFMLVVIGIPPTNFTRDIDLVKAECLKVLLKMAY